MTIDQDGNGEVDFEEFVSLMTNTDIFMQAVEGHAVNEVEVDQYKKRGNSTFLLVKLINHFSNIV